MTDAPKLTAEQAAEVLRLSDGAGQLEAIAYVRRSTHMGLADAVAAVRALLVGRTEQDFWAHWLAVGEFRPELIPHLGYSAQFYEQTRPGAKIVVCVLDMFRLSEVQKLADCLGVDPFDFNTHVVDPARVRLELLGQRSIDDDDHDDDDFADVADSFAALRDAGFRFYFRLFFP